MTSCCICRSPLLLKRPTSCVARFRPSASAARHPMSVNRARKLILCFLEERQGRRCVGRGLLRAAVFTTAIDHAGDSRHVHERRDPPSPCSHLDLVSHLLTSRSRSRSFTQGPIRVLTMPFAGWWRSTHTLFKLKPCGRFARWRGFESTQPNLASTGLFVEKISDTTELVPIISGYKLRPADSTLQHDVMTMMNRSRAKGIDRVS